MTDRPETTVPKDTPSQTALFGAAAAALACEAALNEPVRDLLETLSYLDGHQEAATQRATLLRAASRFQRIFTMPANTAPGLIAFGAEVDPAAFGIQGGTVGSVSGTGLTPQQAFEACVGEGAEYLSQFATTQDELTSLTDEQALNHATPALLSLWDRLRPFRRDPSKPQSAWLMAADLSDGRPVPLPADICLRRPVDQRDIDPPWPLSTGCGAGADPLDATLHGLQELIERDAVSLWWRGGNPARSVPPGPGADLLARLRGNQSKRRTWLLDITSDIAVPVVVAVSCNDDGFGLCRGFACRPTMHQAADAALMELMQMELAYQITSTKRATRGDPALNDIDRSHIARYTAINVRATPALQGLAPPAPPCDITAPDRISILSALRQRLDAAGQPAYAVNLTRPMLGIAVVRAVCPGLEIALTAPAGPRLTAVKGSGHDLDRFPPL